MIFDEDLDLAKSPTLSVPLSPEDSEEENQIPNNNLTSAPTVVKQKKTTAKKTSSGEKKTAKTGSRKTGGGRIAAAASSSGVVITVATAVGTTTSAAPGTKKKVGRKSKSELLLQQQQQLQQSVSLSLNALGGGGSRTGVGEGGGRRNVTTGSGRRVNYVAYFEDEDDDIATSGFSLRESSRGRGGERVGGVGVVVDEDEPSDNEEGGVEWKPSKNVRVNAGQDNSLDFNSTGAFAHLRERSSRGSTPVISNGS